MDLTTTDALLIVIASLLLARLWQARQQHLAIERLIDAFAEMISDALHKES
jgi:hypothetical protein